MQRNQEHAGQARAPEPVPTAQADEPDLLRDQFRQLFRHRTLVLAGLLLGLLGGAWLGTAGNGSYAASSEVTLRQPTVDPFAAGGKPADAGISIESERQTALGSAVAGLAAGRLEGRGGGRSGSEGDARLQSGLRVTNPPDTLILRFTYTADSPHDSADRANAFARAFLDNREKETRAQVGKMLDRYRDQRRPLLPQRGNSDSVDAQLAVLDSKIADLTALDTTPGTVVRTALAPSSPAGPGLPMLLGLGAAAGLLLGLLAAWVRLVFDPAARSESDVVRALGAPVLGTLPRHRGAAPLLATGRTAEEYRAVAFRLGYDRRLVGRPRSVLVVAPRGGGDMAATVSVNLAASFVEMDHDVLLVEADLRTPSLTERLRSAEGVRPGWARRPARGDGGWPTGLQIPIDAGESGAFDLIPGARVRNPARALSSTPAGQLLAEAEEPGATLVVHAPPVLSYADAVALSDRVGGVLVVCAPGDVHRADLARIRDLVTGSGGIVLGAVLHSRHGGGRRAAPPQQTADAAYPPPPPQHHHPRTADGRGEPLADSEARSGSGSGTGTAAGKGTGIAPYLDADPERSGGRVPGR